MGTLFLSGWGVALAQTDSTATEKGATLAAAPVAVSAPTETVSKVKEEPKLSVSQQVEFCSMLLYLHQRI